MSCGRWPRRRARPPDSSLGRAPRAMTLSRGAVAMCAAQACAQIGAFSVAALLPTLISAWSLSNTDAGWISGIYYAAYTIVVPLLSSLTDRVDPKRVYLGSVALTAVAFAGFAWVSTGFWSARRTAGRPTGPSYPVGARLFDRVLRAHVGDVCAARLGRHISDVRGRPDLQRLDATGARHRRQRHGPRRRVGQRLGQRAVHSIRPPPIHPRDDAHLRGVCGGERVPGC